MDRPLFTTLLAFSFALLLMYLLFTIISPFLAVLVWSGAIGIITYPIYERLLTRCHGREILASALMTAAVILAVILPLIGLIFSLSQEAALAYQYLERITTEAPGSGLAGILQHPAIAPWLVKIKPFMAPFNLDLEAILLPAVKQGVAYLLNYSTGIIKNFFGFLIKLVLMVIILFFIYRDGLRFLQRFWLIIAIKESLRKTVCETISRVLKAVMYGIFLTCIIQGTLGGLGFYAAGIHSPILFGVLMAVCALIPVVGTAMIWIPAALYLLLQGMILKGVLLIVWGVLAVSSIDNVIRPLFISGQAKLPILLIAFGVLGGLLAFGITGVVAGPLILALCLLFFESYRQKSAI